MKSVNSSFRQLSDSESAKQSCGNRFASSTIVAEGREEALSGLRMPKFFNKGSIFKWLLNKTSVQQKRILCIVLLLQLSSTDPRIIANFQMLICDLAGGI